MQGENLAPKWIKTSWKMVGMLKVKNCTKRRGSGRKEMCQFLQMLFPVELIKRVKREEGQYLEKSVQHRRGLQPNGSTATGDPTHRTGTNPDVFLLGVLDALVTAFVL